MTPREANRILVVGVDWFGDVLFATAALRALRRAKPSAFIAFSTASSCAGLLKNNPNVDQVLSFDEKAFVPGLGTNLRFLLALRALRFDAAVCLHRSATRLFIAAAAGIPVRVGYATPKQRRYLTHALERPASGTHRAAVYARLFEPFGVEPGTLEPDYFLSDDDIAAAPRVLSRNGVDQSEPFAVFHAGGNWDLKRWPARHFAALARRFEKSGMRVVLCGTPKEKSVCDAVVAAAPRAVSLCGQTRVGELAAILQKSRVLISNDSGPLHLAAALGVPSVALFGPTSGGETGPVSRGPARVVESRVGCAVPCYFAECRDRLCLETLTPDEVWKRAEEVLSR